MTIWEIAEDVCCRRDRNRASRAQPAGRARCLNGLPGLLLCGIGAVTPPGCGGDHRLPRMGAVSSSHTQGCDLPFGLSNDGPAAPDKVWVFPVETETSRELIAAFKDKHLDFRVSVLSQEGRVFVATWVHPHSIGGWLYLRTILPFHILIARNALARVGAQRS
jgi:hypothetical protein